MLSFLKNTLAKAPRSPWRRDRRVQLCVEALENRFAPALLFTGSAQGIFEFPSGPSGQVTTGVGTSSLTWGQPGPGEQSSSMTFSPSGSFAARAGKPFVLGTLSYFNGSTVVGTEIDGIGFIVDADITNPKVANNPVNFGFRMDLINTTNDDNDPDA